jgi:hypothetical protein
MNAGNVFIPEDYRNIFFVLESQSHSLARNFFRLICKILLTQQLVLSQYLVLMTLPIQ